MTPFDEFLKHYVSKRYQRARLTYVGMERNGSVRAIAGRVVFELATHPETLPLSTQTGSFSLQVCSLPLPHIEEALRTTDGSSLSFMNSRIDLGTESHGYSWALYTDAAANREAAGWPAVVLRGTGESLFHAIEPERLGRVDRMWSAAQPVPLGSWGEVAQLLGPDWEFYDQRAVMFDFIAPRYCRIESVGLESSDVLTIELASVPDPPDADLSLVVRRERLPGSALRIPTTSWKRGQVGGWTVETPAPHDAGWLEVRLSGSDGTIDFARVPSPGLTADIMSHFDPDGRWLDTMIGRKHLKSQRDFFEAGVAALLGLCRIPVLPLGVRSLTDAVDLVGIVGPHQVIVAECTAGAPTPEKIAHLHARTLQLREHLTVRRKNMSLVSALFFTIPESDVVESVRQVASQYGIALVGRARVHEVHLAATRGEGPQHIWDLMMNWD